MPTIQSSVDPSLDMLTIKDAVRLSKLSAQTWKRWMREGSIRYCRLGPRSIRIPRVELERILRADFAPTLSPAEIEERRREEIARLQARFGKKRPSAAAPEPTTGPEAA